MKSAAFRTKDAGSVFGNVKIFAVDPDEPVGGSQADDNRSNNTKKFNPNEMVLDNGILRGEQAKNDEEEKKQHEEFVALNNQTILQVKPQNIFDF